MLKPLVSSLALMLAANAASAAEDAIASALSAGPASLTKNATIQQWDGTVLREGTNGWTCLPIPIVSTPRG